MVNEFERWWERPSNDPTCDQFIMSGKLGYTLADFEAAMNPRFAAEIANSLAISQKEGRETLLMDTQGGKSTELLATTGVPFSLGYADPCIAVGIFHEDIGIAGAHRKTTTPESSFEAYQQALLDTHFRSRFCHADLLEKLRLMSSAQSRGRVIIQTTQEAVEQFLSLTSNRPPSNGIVVFSYGMRYASPSEVPTLKELVPATLAAHPFMQERGLHGISIASMIGASGELVYGGKTAQQPVVFII